jgi:hypothetical protein
MSHSIPVFLIPIAGDEVPVNLENWRSAYDLMSKFSDMTNENKLWQIISRNWWLEWHLARLCEFLEIKGLEFIGKEISCLGPNELKSGQDAIMKLLRTVTNDIPVFPSEFYPNESLIDYSKIPKEKYEVAVQEAAPSIEIYAHDDAESYEGLVDFLSFVRSLETAMRFCIENNQYLLIVQPQP